MDKAGADRLTGQRMRDGPGTDSARGCRHREHGGGVHQHVAAAGAAAEAVDRNLTTSDAAHTTGLPGWGRRNRTQESASMSNINWQQTPQHQRAARSPVAGCPKARAILRPAHVVSFPRKAPGAREMVRLIGLDQHVKIVAAHGRSRARGDGAKGDLCSCVRPEDRLLWPQHGRGRPWFLGRSGAFSWVPQSLERGNVR